MLFQIWGNAVIPKESFCFKGADGLGNPCSEAAENRAYLARTWCQFYPVESCPAGSVAESARAWYIVIEG